MITISFFSVNVKSWKNLLQKAEERMGIDSFWGIAKTRLSKRRGIKKDVFLLRLKECEFRFNYRNENLYGKMLDILKNNSLF